MAASTSTGEQINTYDTDELARAFPKKPFWGRFLGVLHEPIEGSAEVWGVKVGVKVPIPTHGRFDYAAWLWLNPNRPTWRDPAALRSRLGLERADFDKGLREACLGYARDNPRLRAWVNKRLALAEYDSAGPRLLRPDLRVTATALRFQLMRAQNFLYRDVNVAAKVAGGVVEQALHAAAQHAQDVLGNQCPVSANLMVPAPATIASWLEDGDDTLLRANARSAREVWRDVRFDKVLIIGAETKAAGHQGFWVPVATGQDGKGLPGATDAYTSRVGSAVFVDDLPPLPSGYDRAVENRWHAHMGSGFSDRLFVSIPLVLSRDGFSSDVAAVLNVNARPHPDDGEAWRRAYHDVWLQAAQEGCSEFAQSAYWGFLILQSARRRRLSAEGNHRRLKTGWCREGRLVLPEETNRRLLGMDVIDRGDVPRTEP